MKNKVFTVDDVVGVIKSLSNSKGFYGRLLEQIENMNENEFSIFKNEVERLKFTDALDVVMWLEC